jgi:hypothetical protein
MAFCGPPRDALTDSEKHLRMRNSGRLFQELDKIIKYKYRKSAPKILAQYKSLAAAPS